MANMLLGTPVTSYQQGRQAGLQNRLAEQQLGLREQAGQQQAQQFAQQQQLGQQKQRQGALSLKITEEKLQQLKDMGGFKVAGEKLKSDAGLLNAVLSLPESQQEVGFQAISGRLQPETLEMFGGQYNPAKATALRNTAVAFNNDLKNIVGKPMEVMTEDGKKVLVNVRKDGTIDEIKGYKPAPSKAGISFTTAGGDTIQIGGDVKQGLAKPNIAKQQAAVIGFDNAISSISTIKERFKPEFFTYKGAGKAQAAHLAGKLGIEKSKALKQFSQQRKFLFNEIGQVFNAYRKEITGAAASVQELEQLKATFINKDLGPDEFLAALDQYEQKVLRGRRIASKLLRDGVGIGTKEFGRLHDRAWLTGGDDDPDMRGDEILKENPSFTDEQVIQQLQREGYR